MKIFGGRTTSEEMMQTMKLLQEKLKQATEACQYLASILDEEKLMTPERAKHLDSIFKADVLDG